MTGRLAAAALAAAALLGCPLPQPVNSYPNATAIPPPRILMDGVTPAGTVVYVRSDCPSTTAVLTLSASIDDTNTAEAVSYRWFVDYAPAVQGTPGCFPLPQSGTLQPPADGGTVRPIPALLFDAYAWPPHGPGDLHIVELVVSNGFVDANDPAYQPCPYRTPQPNFETQTYRWVLEFVDQTSPNYPAALCGYPPPP